MKSGPRQKQDNFSAWEVVTIPDIQGAELSEMPSPPSIRKFEQVVKILPTSQGYKCRIYRCVNVDVNCTRFVISFSDRHDRQTDINVGY